MGERRRGRLDTSNFLVGLFESLFHSVLISVLRDKQGSHDGVGATHLVAPVLDRGRDIVPCVGLHLKLVVLDAVDLDLPVVVIADPVPRLFGGQFGPRSFAPANGRVREFLPPITVDDGLADSREKALHRSTVDVSQHHLENDTERGIHRVGRTFRQDNW